MVDLKGYFEETSPYISLMTKDDCRPSDADGTCAFCKDRKRKDHEGSKGLVALFEDYNLIAPEDLEELSNHKYLLCPADIKAFVFKTRVWGKLLLESKNGWHTDRG